MDSIYISHPFPHSLTYSLTSCHQPQIFNCHYPLSCTIIVAHRLLLPPLPPCQSLAPTPPLPIPVQLYFAYLIIVTLLLLRPPSSHPRPTSVISNSLLLCHCLLSTFCLQPLPFPCCASIDLSDLVIK